MKAMHCIAVAIAFVGPAFATKLEDYDLVFFDARGRPRNSF